MERQLLWLTVLLLTGTSAVEIGDQLSAFWRNLSLEIAQLKEDISSTAVDLIYNSIAVNQTHVKDMEKLRTGVNDIQREFNLKLSRLPEWVSSINKSLSDLQAEVKYQKVSQEGMHQHIRQTSSSLGDLQKISVLRGCQSPFVMYGTSCYWFSKKIQAHEFARKSCTALGGYLVKVDDMNEDNFLNRQMFLHDMDNAWIGYMKDSTGAARSKYYQSSGRKQPFTNWVMNEPSSEAEECVEILMMLTTNDCYLHYKNVRYYCDHNLARNARWNDDWCSYSKPFICEVSVTTGFV